jgi:tetratricopeptide (TPR) repeat protein
MSRSGLRDASGGPQPLEVDDQQMWDDARRAPLSAAALQRIAGGIASQQPARVFAWRELGRWRVWAAAALLLLIGGAAAATFVVRRPNAEAIREAATRAAPARGQPDRPPDAPAGAAATPLAAAPHPASPPVALRELPVRVDTPAPAAVAQARKAPPVQLALRAPAVVTRTMAVPTAPSPAPEPASPSGASAEAVILRAALTALHRNDDPAAALALLDQYDARFPEGTLRGEATLARARSLRELGRDDELLRLLERMSFADVPRATELRVLRGELRLTRRRFADALADFEAGLVAGAPDPIVERALFGRASSRSRLGDADGARADLRRYLERFPASPRAAEVRARLAR